MIPQTIPPRRQGPSPLQFILLGAFLLVVFPYLWYNIYAEYRGMGSSPQQIDLATVPAPRPNRGIWVSIPQIEIDCENRAVDRGRSPHTYYVAHAPGSNRPVVIDAGAGRTSCAEIPTANLRGVLRPVSQRRRDYLQGRGLDFAPEADALAFTWGETPRSSRVLLYLLPFIGMVGIGLVGTGVSRFRRRVRIKVNIKVNHREI